MRRRYCKYEHDTSVVGRSGTSCRECRRRQAALKRRGFDPGPSYQRGKAGFCRKGLHAWVPENIIPQRNGRHRCRPCSSAGSVRYHAAHREKRAAYRAAYYAAHREEEAESCRHYQCSTKGILARTRTQLREAEKRRTVA